MRVVIYRVTDFSEANPTRAFQYIAEPPAYIILSKCEAIAELIRKLQIPNGSDDIYYSILVTDDYLNKMNCHNHDKFTIELFGLKLKTVPMNSLAYQTQPFYWRESPQEVIQVWRMRIFICRPQELNTTESNPISSDEAPFPCLEERWHPEKSYPTIHLQNLANPETGHSLLKFYTRLSNIDSKRNSHTGRPPGSGWFRSDSAFFRAMMITRKQLQSKYDREPTQKEVAWAMSVSLSTFKQYWGRISKHQSLQWRDLYDLGDEGSQCEFVSEVLGDSSYLN